MRFLWNSLIIVFLLCGTSYADTKITALPADTAPTGDDLTVTVNDPGGTPATKKSTLSNLSKGLTVTSMVSACTDAQVLGGNLAGTGVECQADVDTNANTICTGTTTYLDGEGNCDDISSVYSPLTAPTFATSITGSYLTASEILITDGSKNIVSAPVATYPSLTELTYVKGVTSAIQTQLGTKDAVTTAGRSLTRTTNDFAADAELYTHTFCYRLPASPVATDDDKSVWINDTANGFTVTKLWCESDQTVTAMLQVDDGSVADMDTVDLVCISTPDTDTSLDGDAGIAAGDRVDLDVASVSGTPTWATICFTGTWDD